MIDGGTPLWQLTVDQFRAVLREETGQKAVPAAPAPCSTLLARSGLAQRLCCSLATLDRLVLEGLPYVVIGRTKRFDSQKVDAWIASRPLPEKRVAEPLLDSISLAGVRRLGVRRQAAGGGDL